MAYIYALGLSFSLAAVIAIAWTRALERQAARKLARQGVLPVCRALPSNIALATAWRNRSK